MNIVYYSISDQNVDGRRYDLAIKSHRADSITAVTRNGQVTTSSFSARIQDNEYGRLYIADARHEPCVNYQSCPSLRRWFFLFACMGAIWGPWLAVAKDLELAHETLVTSWTKSSNSVRFEYPRPTMRREDWLSLNGDWEIGETFWTKTNLDVYSGKIAVPFPAGSYLSGVKKPIITERQRLWYRRRFSIPQNWSGKHVLLHFEAADWETKVWVNGKEQGMHRGGYDRFSFDITPALKSHGEQELVVSVYDPSDSGHQPRGKQELHPSRTFYSSVSGIWQSVWLEPVAEEYVDSLRIVPNIDSNTVTVTAITKGTTNKDKVEIVALDGTTEIGRSIGDAGRPIVVHVPAAKLWTPESPILYDIKVRVLQDANEIDAVQSYFGMRKISVTKSERGNPKIMLNNKQVFQLGPLDQGYWPDGLYTAPSDEALRYDVEVMKKLGFNMCRKHVKVEPERWYYWCDKLGLLVWQDMPNGDRPTSTHEKEIQRRQESAQQFEQELTSMIQGRGNHPCIVMWVAFNQGWGQYDTARITEMIKKLDPSRLVISASGWHDAGLGDVRAFHAYPGPAKIIPDGKRPVVLGESGGLGFAVDGHIWKNKGNWNTIYFDSADSLTENYCKLLDAIADQKVRDDLSAAVITQLTDVETELNGFMTYDRAVIKMPVERVREANEKLIRAGAEKN